MSFHILAEACIGCGACEVGCPTEAVLRPPIEQGNVFWVETYRCNDCGWCPTVCPVDCILPDPDTIVCGGRGCPVANGAKGPFAGWKCTRMEHLCTQCGDVLWREGRDTEASWRCARCELATHVGCPKTLALRKGRRGQKPLRKSPAELYERRDADRAPRGVSA